MNRKKTILYLIFVSSLFVWLESYFFYKKNQELTLITEKVDAMQNASLVFAGTSYVALGIDTEGTSYSNIAANSEPYLFTYKKIQLLKPKVVVLGVNPQSFQVNYEQAANEGLLSVRQFDYLHSQLNEDEYKDLHQHIGIEAASLYNARKAFPFLGSRCSFEDSALLFGGFNDKGASSKLDAYTSTQRFLKEFQNGKSTFSDFQKKYLFEIANYCRQENIRLVLLSTPIHQTMLSKIPPEAIVNYEKELFSLQNNFGLKHYNYKNSKYPDAYFYDSDHLNGVGARAFTRELLIRLKLDGCLIPLPINHVGAAAVF